MPIVHNNILKCMAYNQITHSNLDRIQQDKESFREILKDI